MQKSKIVRESSFFDIFVPSTCILAITAFISDQAELSSNKGRSNNECAYNNLQCNVECANESNKNTTLTMALGVVSALCVLFVLVCILLICYIVYNKCIERRQQQAQQQQPHGGNQQGQENEGQPHDREDDQRDPGDDGEPEPEGRSSELERMIRENRQENN